MTNGEYKELKMAGKKLGPTHTIQVSDMECLPFTTDKHGNTITECHLRDTHGHRYYVKDLTALDFNNPAKIIYEGKSLRISEKKKPLYCRLEKIRIPRGEETLFETLTGGEEYNILKCGEKSYVE